MGNQVSSQTNEDTFGFNSTTINKNHNNINERNGHNKRDQILANNYKNDSLEGGLFKDNLSNYNGVVTDNSSIRGISIYKDKESTKNLTNNSEAHVNECLKELKVPTRFEWREGGNVIYLTGSFCNWNQKFLMIPNTNKFEISLDLPRGVHEYKFVVDGQWVFSKQHLTCNDCSGNINNIIDTRSYPTPDIPRSSKAIKENSSKLNSDPTPRFILESKSYKCLYPSKNDLNVEATLCPENYKNNFSRSAFPNSNIICSTKNEFTNSNQIIFSNENSSIKLSAIPQHVNLNHLCLKSKEDTNSRQVIVTSTTHRVRHKFLTIIYLKPLN